MRRPIDWTTPAELKERVLQRWLRGAILAARLTGEAEFPMRLPLRRPQRRELLERFDDARAWIAALREGSAEMRGFGYVLEWEEVEHRQLGANRVPRAAVIATEADAVRLIGKATEARRFGELCAQTLEEFPELRTWLAKRPMVALEYAEEWSRILSVLRWFRANPRPKVYLRQVDAPGVDTKFIEGRRGLLAELLAAVLPPSAIDPEASGAVEFERRFGLKTRPALIRMRVLDRRLAISGLTDVTAPVEELAALAMRPERVLITENDTNALALPEVPGGVVLFGKGYALELIASLPWVMGADVHYWGDLDTHGFAILDAFRAVVPGARSLLMDRETLLQHRTAWTQEGEAQRCLRDLGRLTAEERAVYDELRGDRLGERVRLEQERIAFGAVVAALRRVCPGGTDPISRS